MRCVMGLKVAKSFLQRLRLSHTERATDLELHSEIVGAVYLWVFRTAIGPIAGATVGHPESEIPFQGLLA